METRTITEGATRLVVPVGNREKGPGARDADVFFNPAMAASRDVGVLVVHAAGRDGWRLLDGLAAGGARGLRYAVEAGHDLDVTLNDWNPAAVAAAEANAAANGVAARVTRRTLGSLLWEETWHVVEVDPFGSPAPFVDAAARAVRKGGLLNVSATDTAALFGTWPKVARRRYLARPMHAEVGHEVALRVLAGFLTRQAAKHEHALTPVLSTARGHAYRVHARLERGAGRTDDALARIGFAWLCAACHDRGLADDAPSSCPRCGGEVRTAGPLWTGPLHDADLTRSMREAATRLPLARPKEVLKDVDAWADEADAPALHYDTHEAAARARVDPQPLEAIARVLREQGFAAARTHTSPHAVRTDATSAELEAAIREAARRR